MTIQFESILLNRRPEIARLQEQLEEMGGRHGLPPRILHDVQLAVEEHLTNILKHGFDEQSDHPIRVRVSGKGTELRVEIEDEGRPFDPLKHPAPELSQPLEMRPVGGLGIYMMRKLMDRIEYHREGGKNLLVMIKEIKAPIQ